MWENRYQNTHSIFSLKKRTENILGLKVRWDFLSSHFHWPIFPTKVEATEEEAINTRMMCPSSSVLRILAHSRIESKVKVLLLYLTRPLSRIQNVFLVENKMHWGVGSDAHCLIKVLKVDDVSRFFGHYFFPC